MLAVAQALSWPAPSAPYSYTGIPRHFPMKPCAGSRPIPLHRSRSNFQYLRNLLQGEPSKEAQFYDSALARVHFGEMVERLIEGEDVNILSAGHHRRVLE